MSAHPTIKAVSATKNPTSTLIMALLDNTSRGMVQMRAYLGASCVNEDIDMRTEWCVEQSTNPHISGLYHQVNAYKTTSTTASSACLRAYICSSGENCDTLSCNTWNISYNSEFNNIQIDNAFGFTPIEVSNLSLNPGNGSISASWSDINQTTSIWCYDVMLDETIDQNTARLISGSVIKNNMIINNLTNGTEYKVSVRARSFDGYAGPWLGKTATPNANAQCVIPACTVMVE